MKGMINMREREPERGERERSERVKGRKRKKNHEIIL